MLEEMIAKIEDMASDRVRATIKIVTPDDLAHGHFAALVYQDGDGKSSGSWGLTVFDYPRAAQAIDVETPNVLHDYLSDNDATLFIDDERIVAYLGNVGEFLTDRPSVSCDLMTTPGWNMARVAIQAAPEGIVQMQKLLFANLQKVGTIPGVPIDEFCRKYLPKVRMTVAKTLSSQRENGGDSMGADVHRTAMGGEQFPGETAWPDYVTITTQVYKHVGIAATIPYVLSFVHDKNLIRLDPVTEYVDLAREEALGVVASILEGANRRIVRGRLLNQETGKISIDQFLG